MNSIERGGFDRYHSKSPEHIEPGDLGGERGPEEAIDLRMESELFNDHERVDNDRDTDSELTRLRDTLSDDQDGVLRIALPEYDYDFMTNPFIGMGPQVRRTYAVSRYLDVVFLHRFMYHDILVCGIRTREFVSERGRMAFVHHIRDTGGLPLRADGANGYDFLALKFAPYVASDTTAAWFTLYHKQEPLSLERPHYPIDAWVIYDANAYQEAAGPSDFRKPYTLKVGYNRRMSVLGIALIN